MSYTFLGAIHSNAAGDAVIAVTEEVGAVALSVIDTPEEWSALLDSGVAIAAYVEPISASIRISKADLWRRLSDVEADQLDAALQATTLRLRRIFEAAQFIDTADDDFPALRAGIVAALGEERANEVLAPTA